MIRFLPSIVITIVFCPILLRLAPDRWRRRALDLDPVIGAAGRVSRAHPLAVIANSDLAIDQAGFDLEDVHGRNYGRTAPGGGEIRIKE
jgi:hypothetical protein